VLNSSSSQLLLTLKGHLSIITDLQYAYAGDRLLSASQKDGVVRIWSWSFRNSSEADSTRQPTTQLSHILIQLTNPNSRSSGSAGPRRGPNRNSSTPVSCDVAAWSHDDTKIITSQCELVKQSGVAINPGSQFLFLWDSVTGHCLMGIAGAHTTQCPVIVPHPFIPSIVCSAGADGILNVWDFDTGTRFYSFKNKVDYGPVEDRDLGKISGFLDGAFFPDGSGLVLTDDSGRVTVFDCSQPRTRNDQLRNDIHSIPAWMKEQYFAHDYYDLYYDSNGYCVERGSEQPPHLAPKGVRCSNAGVPMHASVNDTFKGIAGPLPVGENEARWRRQLVFSEACTARKRQLLVHGNIVSHYDPETTVLVDGCGNAMTTAPGGSDDPQPPRARQQPSTETSARSPARLSSNYRWRDFTDLPPEDANDEDEPEGSGDEEFELQERPLGQRQDSDSEDLDEGFPEEESPAPRRLGGRDRRANHFDEDDSDADVMEFMSTNNKPSGPFAADYDDHFFRMQSSARVTRAWLRRLESNSSYGGRKPYSPQVGDSVVYIPRAHQDTISIFPSMQAPWQNWPGEAEWPVVRCCIRHMRYRFPFKNYFNNNGR
jgi:hypothetical protein